VLLRTNKNMHSRLCVSWRRPETQCFWYRAKTTFKSLFLAPIGLVSELRTNLSQSAFKNGGSKYDEQGEGEKVQHRNMQEQEEYNKRPRNTRKVGIEERW